MTKTHWLYGDREFNIEVDDETSCSECVHRIVCSFDHEKLCSNFVFGGVSRHGGCQSCSHRYTRYDKDKIPCFHCPHFRKE